MRIPPTPPDHIQVLTDLFQKQAKAGRTELEKFAAGMSSARPTDERGRYLHWDEVRFREPPFGLDLKTYWALTRRAREFAGRAFTIFADTQGRPFTYTPVASMERALHEIDSAARGSVGSADASPGDPEARRFLVNSLVEEPFNSSLLEGAATTRDQAKKLIQQGRKPRNHGERMVLNNFQAIEFIKAHKRERLTPAIVHEVHRLITLGTLGDASQAGRLRNSMESINVVDDSTGEILHRPPAAAQLEARLSALCDFANQSSDADPFLHPVLKAIVLHFMLAYDHPYTDGNGRTARALFYWSVLRDDYWLLEYVSISKIINQAPVQYYKSFLYTETDSGDLTYFILHQLEMVQRSLSALNDYIETKKGEIADLSQLLSAGDVRGALNHRQLALIHHAIRTLVATYTIDSHLRTHGVSYLTARADLEGLYKLKLLSKRKLGTTSIYRPAPGLRAGVEELASIAERA